MRIFNEPPIHPVFDDQNRLIPLHEIPKGKEYRDVAAIIVSRDRPDLVEQTVSQLEIMSKDLKVDAFVVEMGTSSENLSKYCTIRYPDEEFRGKCFGHNVGLRIAVQRATYKYYWILMNDLVFEPQFDALSALVRISDENPRIAVLSPTEPEAGYPSCKPVENSDYHKVSTSDYLALLMRAEAINDVEFLNPSFKYSWGAIHELAYKLYSKGWWVAYCDKVPMKHLGGTTYGKAKGTISRDEYQFRAKEFAARYFVEHYGSDWDEKFTKVLSPDIKINTFKIHRYFWESALENEDQCVAELAGVGSDPLDEKQKLLKKKIDSLNPWYYEVEIGGIRVVPGINSKQTPEELNGRVEYRTKLLVDAVAEQYDFHGKSLLDIASNCGYWSARYAERGAASLLAVEGRYDYVQQGLLYWGENSFLSKGSYEFIHGDVTAEEMWKKIRAKGTFDFTLCAGILYHIPEYEKLLRFLAKISKEAILIDTRISDSQEHITEPGGWCFDAIIETRVKRVPSLKFVESILKEEGFEVRQLRIEMATPKGLLGNDDYNSGRRIALLATK